PYASPCHTPGLALLGAVDPPEACALPPGAARRVSLLTARTSRRTDTWCTRRQKRAAGLVASLAERPHSAHRPASRRASPIRSRQSHRRDRGHLGPATGPAGQGPLCPPRSLDRPAHTPANSLAVISPT